MSRFSDKPPKERFSIAKRIASAVARAFREEPEYAKEENWKKELKQMLFRHERNALVAEMKISPEKVLYMATLLLNEDYRLSAGWILINATQENVDLSVARPYLVEGLDSNDKNVRCLCARALTFHYLNTCDLPGIRSVAETDDLFVRKDVFDSVNSYATYGHAGAVSFLAVTLGHPERSLRELAASALELAVELGDKTAREKIRGELEPLAKTTGVPNLPALKSAEKIIASIELREKRST